ncbi:hypothetical protein G9A89_010883 [Geosiphon pyriformis]|nr:hypothetical protein G9A89_010883 [Geosiphon pyriformis]
MSSRKKSTSKANTGSKKWGIEDEDFRFSVQVSGNQTASLSEKGNSQEGNSWGNAPDFTSENNITWAQSLQEKTSEWEPINSHKKKTNNPGLQSRESVTLASRINEMGENANIRKQPLRENSSERQLHESVSLASTSVQKIRDHDAWTQNLQTTTSQDPNRYSWVTSQSSKKQMPHSVSLVQKDTSWKPQTTRVQETTNLDDQFDDSKSWTRVAKNQSALWNNSEPKKNSGTNSNKFSSWDQRSVEDKMAEWPIASVGQDIKFEQKISWNSQNISKELVSSWGPMAQKTSTSSKITSSDKNNWSQSNPFGALNRNLNSNTPKKNEMKEPLKPASSKFSNLDDQYNSSKVSKATEDLGKASSSKQNLNYKDAGGLTSSKVVNSRKKGEKKHGNDGSSATSRDSSRQEFKKPLKLPELMNIEKPPKTGFRSIPIIPTQYELLQPRPQDLPDNKLDEAYENVDQYLETHFRLLREDCIRPLREGIKKLREPEPDENIDDPTESDISDIRIYEHVQIVGVTFAIMGVIHRISFRTPFGTLVVFTNDNFKTMIIGTVVNRPLIQLDKKFDLQIDVLLRNEDVEFVWGEGYIMIEATSSYFEAYRHVLTVLQELDPETLPFKSHLVDRDYRIEQPEYLIHRHPVYEFKNADAIKNLCDTWGTSRINVRDGWPDFDRLHTSFHSSQYNALQCMITKRIALVQGPPGTGKTYVGLQAIRLLTENMPGLMIIACQTNHALDQFLEGIQEFEENIIRLGSRSKSEKIIPRTLYQIRKDLKESDPKNFHNPKLRNLFREKDQIENRMMGLCEQIKSPCVTLAFVKENGLLNETQLSSLQQDDWHTSKNYGDDEESERAFIREWLDQVIVTHSSTHDFLEHQLSQLDIEGRIPDPEDDPTEVDEEIIEEMDAEFQDVESRDEGEKLKGEFGLLRSEEFVDSTSTYVTEEEVKKYLDYDDVWAIPLHVRAAIHNKWRQKILEVAQDELKSLNKKYTKISAEIKMQRVREDIMILRTARIVGMTTTAAAKNHVLLVNLKPKIIMIEEAAETLEAHIVTSLSPATQHLILIGDHEQLRPSTAVQELAIKHRLDVSLFERLTRFLYFSQLSEQRRMRPAIRELLRPIYKTLITDAEKVKIYPNVKGMLDNLYFLDHQEAETNVQDTKTKINEFEALMCAKLASYLVKGGYEAQRITILTMYTGQRKRILKLLREESSKSISTLKLIKVSSVDGFQGEENDIIILSLVRSSAQRRIGFLSVSNRGIWISLADKTNFLAFKVCVALSRAKHGMYIFGNAGQLAEKSELWRDVLLILEEKKSVGKELTLYCQKHSTPSSPVITKVSWAGQFPPEGGCTRKCGKIMECGHICPRDCHIFPHDQVKCWEPCIRTLPCGHQCPKECRDSCEPCEVSVQFTPECGHTKEIPCKQQAEKFRCAEKCAKKLKCGHTCEEICSSPWCTTACRIERVILVQNLLCIVPILIILSLPSLPIFRQAVVHAKIKPKTHPAIIDTNKGASHSYSDLIRDTTIFRNTLLNASNSKGTFIKKDLGEARVAILCPSGYDYVVAQWATWAAGGVAVPLCISHPSAEILYTLKDSAAEILVTNSELYEKARDVARFSQIKSIIMRENPSTLEEFEESSFCKEEIVIDPKQ